MSLRLVLLAGVLARVAILVIYAGPAQMPDTNTYFRMAEQIWHWDFANYAGWRTPGYPLLLLLCAREPGLVWLLQAVAGLATTAIVYVLVARCIQSAWAATIAALAHALALNHLFLEATLLSETLATLLLTLSFYLMQRASSHGWASGRLALSGASTALAALTRPVSVVAGAVLAGWAAVAATGRRAVAFAVFTLFFAAPVIAWCAFNQATIGQFGMSTLIGFTLTNHSGAFIERAPSEFSTIRDIYLRYREENIARTGTHRMTVFDAREELKARTGLNDVQLSQELTRMSITLFKAYPADYVRSVIEAWMGFWAVPIPVDQHLLRGPHAQSLIFWLSLVEKWIFRATYAAFLILSIPTLWMALYRNRAMEPAWNCAAAMVLLVLCMSVMQALLENGAGGRYAIPTQSLAISAVVIAVTRFTRRSK